MRIRLSTLRQLIREAVDEATCGCGGANQGVGCQCGTYEIAETDKEDKKKKKETKQTSKDKDGDGDTDFADVMTARRIASGQSKQDAIKASSKHNESVSRFLPWR